MEGEKYHVPNLFPSGTIHHSAEIGSVKAIQDVLQQQKAKRGLPPLVVLEERDELLQVLITLQMLLCSMGHSTGMSYVVTACDRSCSGVENMAVLCPCSVYRCMLQLRGVTWRL